MAYETLGQIDFSQLSRVPRQLAWELCGLVAQLAEKKKRYPAAILALANQTLWIPRENLRPWAINEIRSRVEKLQTAAEVDWVSVPGSRTSSPPVGPEATLPDLQIEEVRNLLLLRRRKVRGGK